MPVFDDKDIQKTAEIVLSALRRGEGLNRTGLEELRSALIHAAEAWRDIPSIPKSAANLFIDLGSGIESCRYLYPGSEGDEIAKVAEEISALIRECVSE